MVIHTFVSFDEHEHVQTVVFLAVTAGGLTETVVLLFRAIYPESEAANIHQSEPLHYAALKKILGLIDRLEKEKKMLDAESVSLRREIAMRNG